MYNNFHKGDQFLILVVEDDEDLRTIVSHHLRKDNYLVDNASDGEEALQIITKNKPDLIVLDLGLPEMDGFQVLEKLRQENPFLPVFILTAKEESADKVKGFDLGADDYMVKPLQKDEFLARVKALLRRNDKLKSTNTKDLQAKGTTLLVQSQEIQVKDKRINLTQLEFDFLYFLFSNKNTAIPRARILEEVWGYDPKAQTNTIDVFVSTLRKKIEVKGQKRIIETKHGIGYIVRD